MRAKKARERELDHYLAPDEVINASESERRRLLSEAVWWAFTHDADADPPDEARRVFQKLKRRNESLFLKQFVLAVLPGPPKEPPLPAPEPERTIDSVIGRKVWNQLLESLAEYENASPGGAQSGGSDAEGPPESQDSRA
jgi:hypothetical protein